MTTIDELAEEMRTNHQTLSSTVLQLSKRIDNLDLNGSATARHLSERIDNLDLNGTAEHLRTFGKWLGLHPDFMRRAAADESKRTEREIAFRWMAQTFHLVDLKKKLFWALSVVFAGTLLAFGTDLYGLKPIISHALHALSGGFAK